MFLPSYSPNLDLIERLRKFIKRRALYGRYHPTFADFRAAIEQTLSDIPTQHAADLASLMTLNFQWFENASLMAARGIVRDLVLCQRWRVSQNLLSAAKPNARAEVRQSVRRAAAAVVSDRSLKSCRKASR